MIKQPKIVAIQDVSGIGRCSLSVIIPVLSTMGVQVCAVPTAVLSTHTGGLGTPARVDLTDYLPLALDHYKSLELDFDAVYSGYLANPCQADCVMEYIRAFPRAIAVVDPVMGDGGKVYSSITTELIEKFRQLTAVADIITPNLTEAYLLLGRPYPQRPPDSDEAKELVTALGDMGAIQVVLKGLIFNEGEIANLIYTRHTGEILQINNKKYPSNYPGTGDIFASVMLGELVQGGEIAGGCKKAADFLEYVIEKTYETAADSRYGVLLEENLGWFYK